MVGFARNGRDENVLWCVPSPIAVSNLTHVNYLRIVICPSASRVIPSREHPNSQPHFGWPSVGSAASASASSSGLAIAAAAGSTASSSQWVSQYWDLHAHSHAGVSALPAGGTVTTGVAHVNPATYNQPLSRLLVGDSRGDSGESLPVNPMAQRHSLNMVSRADR